MKTIASLKTKLALLTAMFGALLAIPGNSPATVVSFGPGSLIIPMDNGGQSQGILRAYGLVYELLSNNVPVSWAINPAKSANGNDFGISLTDGIQDVRTGATISFHGYRGGPFVIDAADAAAALPIIHAWQATAGDQTAVHFFTGPGSFAPDVSRRLVSAPRIAILKDGNETIAFNNLNAAGIPDSTGAIWNAASPDLLTEAEVAGASAVDHTDGLLFNSPGGLTRYGYVASMHYITTGFTPEVVQEFRAALGSESLGHAFMQCAAITAFENDPTAGHFLSTLGLSDDGAASANPAILVPFDPLSQIDGLFDVDPGQVDSIGLAPSSSFRIGVSTIINHSGSVPFQRIVLLTGRLDGISTNGRVTYLVGHDYSVDLPISSHSQTNGVRLFLNSIFDSDCAATHAQPDVMLTVSAPALVNSNQIAYTITATNPGPRPVENVQLMDRLPVGTAYVPGSGLPAPIVAGGLLTWNLPPLAPSVSATVTFQVSVSTDGTYADSAQLSGTDLALRLVASDPATTVRDTVPPTVSVTAGPTGNTSNATPAFKFITDVSAVTKVCSIDNVNFTPCSPDPAAYTVGTALSDGPHMFIVKVTDAAGNTAQATRGFNVDTTPPTVTIADPPNNSTATSNPAPSFFFTADDPPATTFCSVAGDPFVQCTSPFTSRTLTDGSYTFSVFARDPAGNTGPTANFIFAVDHLAPIVSIPVPPNVTTTSSHHPTFTFSDVGPSGTAVTYLCRIDAGPDTSCISPFAPNLVADGPHTLTVTGTDAAGNTGQASLSFILDSIAPLVTIPGAPANPANVNSSTPTFVFQVSNTPATTPVVASQCSIYDAVPPNALRVQSPPGVFCDAAFTVPLGSSLNDGLYTFKVRATDAAGNVGENTFNFVVDTHPPIVSIPVPPNVTITNSPNPSFTFGDVSAPGTPVAFQCSIDGSPNVPCASPYTVGTLVEGTHALTVTGTDAAGNVGSASLGFVVDLTPPAVTITSWPPVGSTNPMPTFAFTTSGAIATQCSIDTGAFVSCTSPFTVPSPLAVGAHTFTVRATDAAGNVASASRAFTINAAVVLVSIQVTPTNPSVPAGRTVQFTATGTFSDGTNQDLTSTCMWSAGNASIVSISNANGATGVAIGILPGTTQITASLGSVSGSTTLTVTAAVLVSIDITPTNSTITVGGARQFTATGTFSDGTHQDLTVSCAWLSNNLSVAKVSNATGSKGAATGVSAGTALITAASGSIPGSTMLTVTAPVDPCTTGVVLDNFNRANGALGNNWAGLTNTSFYKIAGNRVDAHVGGPVFWNAASFGANQNAFVTLSTVDPHSPSQGVLLKVQTGNCPQAGAIAVVYDATAHAFRVSTFRPPNLTWTPYASASAALVNGDKLGACVSATGVVTIYKNNVVVATVTLSAADKAFFNSKGGKIGLWTLLADEAFFDDFGGGTVSP